MFRQLGAPVFGCIVACAAACTDHTPDTSVNPSLHATAREPTPPHNGKVAFRCVLGQRDAGSGHWLKRPATIYFPRPETTPDEPLLPYRYEVANVAGEMVRFADCAIPRSKAAIRRMDRAVRAGAPGVERLVVSAPLRSGCYTYNCPVEGIVVKVTPTPELAPEDDWNWDWASPDPCPSGGLCDGSGGGGGGGGGGTPPEGSEECNPALDPNCLRPLFADDTVSIRQAFTRFRRPDTEFTDEDAKRECGEMYTKFDQLYQAGEVYRGNSSSNHYGEEWMGTIHFDPNWLNAAMAGDTVALKEIAVTAYHEAAHTLGYTHGDPRWVGGVDIYTEPYFNRLTPGGNSCIKR